MFARSRLPAAGSETFFLWGPRQTGKTTLLRAAYGGSFWVIVCLESASRRTEDGILVLPAVEFCKWLGMGDLF